MSLSLCTWEEKTAVPGVVKVLKIGVAAHLRVEHSFYSLASNLEQFRAQCGIRRVLCPLSEEGALVLNF